MKRFCYPLCLSEKDLLFSASSPLIPCVIDFDTAYYLLWLGVGDKATLNRRYSQLEWIHMFLADPKLGSIKRPLDTTPHFYYRYRSQNNQRRSVNLRLA